MSDDPFPPVVCTYGDLCELERRWHAFSDLLAACEAIVAADSATNLRELIAAAELARAAVAKAKGGSQEQGQ